MKREVISTLALILIIVSFFATETEGAIGDPHAIYGYVYDENNNPLANVKITATNERTNEILTLYSDDSGRYLIQLLNFPSGYKNGDTIKITVSYAGSNYDFEVIVDTSVGNQLYNLVISPSNATEGSEESATEHPLTPITEKEVSGIAWWWILIIILLIIIGVYYYIRKKNNQFF